MWMTQISFILAFLIYWLILSMRSEDIKLCVVNNVQSVFNPLVSTYLLCHRYIFINESLSSSNFKIFIHLFLNCIIFWDFLYEICVFFIFIILRMFFFKFLCKPTTRQQILKCRTFN